MKRQIAVIAAMAKNRVIGAKGRIPWDLPEDRGHFKELTMGNAIVMGRHTYEEIGYPLPGRITYLLSSTRQMETEGLYTATSLTEVLEREQDRDIFICGGARLYQEALPLADRLYLTELEWDVKGDTYFPEFNKKLFHIEEKKYLKTSSGEISFVTYSRRG